MRLVHSGSLAARPKTILALSVGWMLLVQLTCLLAWEHDWLTRYGALAHWVLVGVVPPALALWQSERTG